MSNCCANSASVFSPLTAAKATFALKAGVWFRRGRLVIASPVRHAVWPPGPLPPKPGKGRQLQRRDAEHQPVSAKDLAVTLPPSAWQTVSWRQGSRGDLSGRFATVRVRPSHRDYGRAEPHPEEWLLIEWPAGDKEPSKY